MKKLILLLYFLPLFCFGQMLPLHVYFLGGGNGDGYDSDVLTWIDSVESAGGNLTANEKTRVNTFVENMKSTNEWDSCIAIYPMRGDSTAMRINLKNPGTFDLTFINTVTGDYSSGGWTGNVGNSAYAKTGIVPSTHMIQNNTHISYYSNTNDNAGTICEIGALITGYYMKMHTRYTGDYFYGIMYSTSGLARIYTTNTTTDAYFILSRIASNDLRAYKDGSQLGSTATGTVPGTIPTIELYINANNNTFSPEEYSGKQCQLVTIGQGLTSGNVTNINNYAQTLNSDR